MRPELLFGAFSCLECGKEVENVAQQFRFTQPNMCRTPNCNNRDKWSLVRERCQFVDWQRVRIQENADEVPAGCLPRSMDAILRHETVETARAGDQVSSHATHRHTPRPLSASVHLSPYHRAHMRRMLLS